MRLYRCHGALYISSVELGEILGLKRMAVAHARESFFGVSVAIYSRRRQQLMLNELGPWLTRAKTADLLSRLDHKDTSNALAAEAELGLLWSLRQMSHIVIEPALPGTSSRLDVVAHHLVPNAAAVVEITALSDDTFSGQRAMERTANIISAYANTIRKKAADHLYFEFGSGHIRDGHKNKRVRFVNPKYKLTPEHEAQLQAWIGDPYWPNPERMAIRDETTAVTIIWKRYVHPHGRVFCSMPPVTYDLEDNHLFRALEAKERQMSGVPHSFVRTIFVADAGCNLLWSPRWWGGQEKSAAEIVEHFLARQECKTDLVCLFSPRRAQGRTVGPEGRPKWSVTLRDRRTDVPNTEYDRIRMLAASLPPARVEGYQARQLHRQGSFKPQGRGRYLGTTIRTSGVKSIMSIELSARLLHELLAGRITREQFQQRAFSREDFNQFEYQLAHGRTIRSARLVPGGVDEDDDLIVFDLADDVAAALLKPPQKPTLRQRFDALVSRLLLSLRLQHARSAERLEESRAQLRLRLRPTSRNTRNPPTED